MDNLFEIKLRLLKGEHLRINQFPMVDLLQHALSKLDPKELKEGYRVDILNNLIRTACSEVKKDTSLPSLFEKPILMFDESMDSKLLLEKLSGYYNNPWDSFSAHSNTHQYLTGVRKSLIRLEIDLNILVLSYLGTKTLSQYLDEVKSSGEPVVETDIYLPEELKEYLKSIETIPLCNVIPFLEDLNKYRNG